MDARSLCLWKIGDDLFGDKSLYVLCSRLLSQDIALPQKLLLYL